MPSSTANTVVLIANEVNKELLVYEIITKSTWLFIIKKYLFILTSLVLFNKISEKFIKLNFPITITITCL